MLGSTSLIIMVIGMIFAGLFQAAYSAEVRTINVDAGVAQTLTFNLESGTKFKGSLSIAGGAGKDINFMVKDPSGNQIISERRIAEGGNFEFTATSNGAYTLYFDNSFSLFSSKQVNLSFDIEKPIIPSNPFGGRCLIATAAFDSELSPQVQFLRHFRDDRILSTEAGKNFMLAFNAWYYSFSPYVADYERTNPILKESVKYMIYPLIGILDLSEKGFHIGSNAEYSSLFSGFIASSMIGSLYFTPVAYFIKQVRIKRPNYLFFTLVVGSALVMLLIAISVGNALFLMVTTSIFVLSTISSFSIFSAYGISALCQKLWKFYTLLHIRLSNSTTNITTNESHS